MIIKSLSRKDSSFEQLVDYIARNEQNNEWDLYHNFSSYKRNNIIEEFTENAKHLSRRKNANIILHEVISITRTNKISEQEQKTALRQIAEKYIEQRAENCLVFADLHNDKDNNIHYHIAFSANELGEKKRLRFPKPKFNKLKIEMEKWVLETYPELEQEVIIQTRSDPKLKELRKEANKKRVPKKEKTIDILNHVFQSESLSEAQELLQKNSLEIYLRNKDNGYKRNRPPAVRDTITDKKYGLDRLKVLDDFHEFINKIELKAEWKKVRETEKEKHQALDNYIETELLNQAPKKQNTEKEIERDKIEQIKFDRKIELEEIHKNKNREASKER